MSNTQHNIYDEQSKAALEFINATPILQSCLYDLNLLPEQLNRGSKDWDKMLILTFHFRDGLAAVRADLAQAKQENKRILTTHVVIMQEAKTKLAQAQEEIKNLKEMKESAFWNLPPPEMPQNLTPEILTGGSKE